MIPHKTARGAAAIERIKLFEGVPPPYDRKKRMVVPEALRVLRLKPGRKYCTVKVRVSITRRNYLVVIPVVCSVCPTRLAGATRMLSTVLRRSERSRLQPTTSARCVPDY